MYKVAFYIKRKKRNLSMFDLPKLSTIKVRNTKTSNLQAKGVQVQKKPTNKNPSVVEVKDTLNSFVEFYPKTIGVTPTAMPTRKKERPVCPRRDRTDKRINTQPILLNVSSNTQAKRKAPPSKDESEVFKKPKLEIKVPQASSKAKHSEIQISSSLSMSNGTSKNVVQEPKTPDASIKEKPLVVWANCINRNALRTELQNIVIRNVTIAETDVSEDEDEVLPLQRSQPQDNKKVPLKVDNNSSTHSQVPDEQSNNFDNKLNAGSVVPKSNGIDKHRVLCQSDDKGIQCSQTLREECSKVEKAIPNVTNKAPDANIKVQKRKFYQPPKKEYVQYYSGLRKDQAVLRNEPMMDCVPVKVLAMGKRPTTSKAPPELEKKVVKGEDDFKLMNESQPDSDESMFSTIAQDEPANDVPKPNIIEAEIIKFNAPNERPKSPNKQEFVIQASQSNWRVSEKAENLMEQQEQVAEEIEDQSSQESIAGKQSVGKKKSKAHAPKATAAQPSKVKKPRPQKISYIYVRKWRWNKRFLKRKHVLPIPGFDKLDIERSK